MSVLFLPKLFGFLPMKKLSPTNSILAFCYLRKGCGYPSKGGEVYHLDLPYMEKILVNPKYQLWVSLVALCHPLAEVPYSVLKEFHPPRIGTPVEVFVVFPLLIAVWAAIVEDVLDPCCVFLHGADPD